VATKQITENEINKSVMPDDELYILGDFAFGDKDKIPSLRYRINCNNIHLIIGNHDQHYIKKRPELFETFSSLSYYNEIRYNKLLISMCHYPLGSWNEIGKGGIMLHGHCHSRYTRTIGRQMDVGWDVLHRPISIKEVYDKMIKIDPVLVDGHTEETNYG
jgi:calcineurin-like phosphoesterase family protein